MISGIYAVSITEDGFKFMSDGTIMSPAGKIIPSISGGRGGSGEEEGDTEIDDSSDDDVNSRPLTLGDLETALAPLFQVIQSMDEKQKQQGSQFDELVDALAQVVDEEEDDSEEEETEEREYRQANRAESDEIARERRERLKLQKQLEEMHTQLQESAEEAEEQHEMWLASERDRLLGEALQKAGVVSDGIEAGVKLFRDSIVFDDDTNSFYFYEDATGVKLAVDEGIGDNLPDFLKESKIRMSGSGGRGSQAASLLDKAKNDLKTLQEKAHKTGQESDIAQYHSQKKKVMEMDRTLADKQSGRTAPRPSSSRAVPVAAEESEES